MDNTAIKTNSTPIILSRGIFDLLKEHIKTKKLSKYNEKKLELELKFAKQVLRTDLPSNIVTVDCSVKVRELDSGQEFIYHLVAPAKAKRKNNTISILSPIGTAMLGYPEGAKLQWEMPEGIKSFSIQKVTPIAI